MHPLTLDHIAFWVSDRATIVERCERHLGMHVIDQQDNFTLVGADARRGKLTFFDADGPRSRGVLAHVGLRVSDALLAREGLPISEECLVQLGDGLCVRLVEAHGGEDDLDHVAFRVPEPERTAAALERYGFDRAGETAVS